MTRAEQAELKRLRDAAIRAGLSKELARLEQRMTPAQLLEHLRASTVADRVKRAFADEFEDPEAWCPACRVHGPCEHPS